MLWPVGNDLRFVLILVRIDTMNCITELWQELKLFSLECWKELLLGRYFLQQCLCYLISSIRPELCWQYVSSSQTIGSFQKKYNIGSFELLQPKYAMNTPASSPHVVKFCCQWHNWFCHGTVTTHKSVSFGSPILLNILPKDCLSLDCSNIWLLLSFAAFFNANWWNKFERLPCCCSWYMLLSMMLSVVQIIIQFFQKLGKCCSVNQYCFLI